VSGSLTVVFGVPMILLTIGIYWRSDIPPALENFIAFSFGLVAKDLTESFIDDPRATVQAWSEFIRKVTLIFASSEMPTIKPDETPEKPEKGHKK
jgi:hypothetical protein